MATMIRPVADAAAGTADFIAVGAFSGSEVLTACRNGSGDLELIGWETAADSFAVTRAADSGSQAGTAQEVTLALLGRTAVTAVRAGDGHLLLITWDAPPGLASVTRIWDSGTAAGAASAIAMTAVGDSLLVTAVRAGDGHLLLICWRLEPDGTLSRLGDSGTAAGQVSVVTIAAVDSANVLTAVRNGSGNLELIGWGVSAAGQFSRWPGTGQAGAVSEIALVPAADGSGDMVTAVCNGSGILELIGWRLSAAAGTIGRLADSGTEAGTATGIAACSALTPSGTTVVLAAVRDGSGRQLIIAFELIADPAGNAVIIRTGDFGGPANVEVSDNALIALETGRILTAAQLDSNLHVTTYTVAQLPPTLIRPVADAAAGTADFIAVGAFSGSEVLTACRNGSGDLELIGWETAADSFAVTRAADSGSQAGTAQEVTLALLGRTAVTAVRAGDGHLLLITWDAPPGLASVTRIWDSGTAAGAASAIAMTAVGDSLLVTAVRAGDGHLLLICWRLEPDGTLSRLGDSGTAAGQVSVVTIAAVDSANVLTAVRNGSGNLELIGWGVSAAGQFSRWPGTGQAGAVSEIALVPAADGSGDMVTAVCNGSGILELIGWRLSAAAGTIGRLADSGTEAGTATGIAACSALTPSGTTVVLAAVRDGSGRQLIIAFELIADPAGNAVIIRTGDFGGPANVEVSDNALIALETGRILTAAQLDSNLHVTTYTVTDASQTLAPADILTIRYENQGLPAIGDTAWATSSGGTFPLDRGMEWVQPLALTDEYDESSLVGCSGWVIVPDDSGADVPFDHPFGFDWEFHIVLDDDKNGYPALLSPASLTGDDRLEAAQALGLPVANGLLGVEWDQGLLPHSFRGQVNHGDRVGIFGRWIIDDGHAFSGFFRTEIHPPLLVATASIQQDSDGSEVTRVVFMSRPYLSGQTYCLNPSDAYKDGIDDDGTLFGHLVNQIADVVLLESLRVEAHPKIKSHPFLGSHSLHLVVSPPPRPEGDYRLAVSFQFTVRAGCTVAVSPDGDSVDVVVTMDSGKYGPPPLPERTERSYGPGELIKLSGGVGTDIINVDSLVAAVVALNLIPDIALFLAAYVAYILSRGIVTDQYAALPEVDVRNADHAVIDVPVDNIPDGAGIITDNNQAHPIFGWLEIGWVPARRKPPLTTATANQWITDVLADPMRARRLGEDWRQLVLDEFAVTAEQRASLADIPPDDARKLQDAVALVVDQGGTIRLERESERSPGRLIVAPEPAGSATAELSVGVFHCTYDANCRNWRCGWGPTRK